VTVGILVFSKKEGETDGSLVTISPGGALTICEGCEVLASVVGAEVELLLVHDDAAKVSGGERAMA
jgi:hypothetical protein